MTQDTQTTLLKSYEKVPLIGMGKALSEYKEKAWQQFQSDGLPTQKDEEWRYVRVKPLTTSVFTPVIPIIGPELDAIKVYVQSLQLSDYIVVLNGVYHPHLSHYASTLPISITAFSDHSDISELNISVPSESRTKNPFEYMNQFMFSDGIDLHIQGQLDRPLYVMVLTSGEENQISVPHITVRSDAKSCAALTLIHHQLPQNQAIDNTTLSCQLDAESELQYVSVKDGGESGTILETTQVSLATSATFKSTAIHITGHTLRQEVRVQFDGEQASSTLQGLSLLDQDNASHLLTDSHLKVPHCTSSQLFKSILSDQSRSDYNGLVYVESDAQKTDSNQLNRHLILSNDAKVYSRPQLRIYADDVVCMHGSTTGQLEKNELLYLMSRGLSFQDSRALLIYGFAEEIVLGISDTQTRSMVESWVKDRLQSFN